MSHAAAPGEVAEAAEGAPAGAGGGRGPVCSGSGKAAKPPSRRTARDYTRMRVLSI